MKRSLLLLGFSFLLTNVFSQNSWHWTRQLNDSLIDKYKNLPTPGGSVSGSNSFVKTDGQQNIYVMSGIRVKFGFVSFTYTDMVRLAKYDKNGNTLWTKYFTRPVTANNGSFRNHIYDMQVDRQGNVYSLMRNYQKYDSVVTPVQNTVNALLKINANGKLVWKKQVGLIETSVSAPQFCRFTLNGAQDQLFVYVDQVVSSPLQFIDSAFTTSVGTQQMLLIKVDSSGSIGKAIKLYNATPTGIIGGITANDQNQVFITGSGGTGADVVIGDTTLAFAGTSGYRKNFYGLFDGNTLDRIWIKTTAFLTANDVVSASIADASFTSTGNIAMLWVISRSNSILTRPMNFGNSQVDITLPVSAENAFIFVTDSLGEIRHYGNIDSNYRSSVTGSRLAVDRLDNFYTISARFNNGHYALLKTNHNVTVFKPVPLKNNATQRLGINDTTPLVFAFFKYAERYFGPDTLDVISSCSDCEFMALSSLGGEANVIRGKLFRDQNSNGKQDTGELVLKNAAIDVNNGAGYVFTDRNGNYMVVTDTGSTIIKPLSLPLYYTSVPSQYSITQTSPATTSLNNDFALQPGSPANEVSINIVPIGRLRPGFNALFLLHYYNNGNTILNGTYDLQLPQGLSYIQSDSTPAFVSPDSIRWNYQQLVAGAEYKNLVKLQAATSLTNGSVKLFESSITPLITDIVPDNNTDTVSVTVTGSYDPNDKLVVPAQYLHIDTVTAGRGILEYTIRFQNTGTDTAFTVHITDTLSALLNKGSLNIIAASHPVELEMEDNHIAHFYFRNILLPDSNINEPLSHGLVRFRIAVKNSCTLSDTIHNKAAIYFDYNDPVITNRVTTYFVENSPLPVTLIHFEAHRKNNIAALKWNTSYESQLSHFEVQRSIYGIEYSKLAVVSASGNNNGGYYHATDQAPVAGLNYYRLKMTDKDGSYRFSNICVLDFRPAIKLDLYPNPATSMIRYSLPSPSQPATLSLVDMNGVRIHIQHLSAFNTSGWVNTRELAAGRYMLIVTLANGTQYTEAFIKQ